jgi:hypothetical protein
MRKFDDSKSRRGRGLPPLDVAMLASAFALPTMALGLLVVRAGPLSISPPRTIVTWGAPAARPVSPYLVFLSELRAELPEGAAVRIVAPRGPSGDVSMNFEIAVGQLPRQRVLREDAPASIGGYVAVYEAPPPAGARLLRRLDGGDLYREHR